MTDKKIKVLMVDDEAQFRETTRKLLNKKGYDTLMAANGEEALEQLDAHPDVVILDIRMPGMDGPATLTEIKRRKPDLPVIMLTGHGEEASARKAHAQGAFDFLAKPCDIDTLALRIQDACRPAGKNAGRQGAERQVAAVMVPLDAYTQLREEQTVAEGIQALRTSFAPLMHTQRLMETGHRSLLVFDAAGELTGVLSIKDLLEAALPAYLSAPKPSTADSLQYSPLFWSGMFQHAARQLADAPVSGLMSPPPPVIAAEANLMEAAYLMVSHGCRRLVVMAGGKLVGVIREQDLFFEMERVLHES